jgi:hypothetical protein
MIRLNAHALFIGNLIETHWKVKENHLCFEKVNGKGSDQGLAAGNARESSCEKGFKNVKQVIS